MAGEHPAPHYKQAERVADLLAEQPTTLDEPHSRHLGGKLNHSEWRTRRHRRLAGEHLDADHEYDRVYEEASLAMTLGKAVYDRRKQLGLSEADLAERLHTTTDEVEGIETATELPPIAVIMRLARALDLTVDMHLTPGDEPTVTIVTPAA